MKRIYPDYAYGDLPRANCWWDKTCDAPQYPTLDAPIKADVAIIGAGFTGLNAALCLAQDGVDVVVLDSQDPGWGASGRNGGFACLGGAKISNSALERRFGSEGRAEYKAAEKAAVSYVGDRLRQLKIDADVHSNGETEFAHRAKDASTLETSASEIEKDYGVTPTFIAKEDLPDHGMNGPFFGALTTPIGFGLNPRKYVIGLAEAASRSGVRIFSKSMVHNLRIASNRVVLEANGVSIDVEKTLIATNGYSSETLPSWLAHRYMPTQSGIIVTEPLSDADIAAQGWSTDQMAFDTRNLLHYFRLMPDRRFLFGMRGGLNATMSANRSALARIRRDFEKMFPAWAHVRTPHAWSGMVCLSRHALPFVGPVPGQPNVFVSMAYHGNGVSMGSYSGALAAELIQGREPKSIFPKAMQQPFARFPLGAFRRLLLHPAYALLALKDR